MYVQHASVTKIQNASSNVHGRPVAEVRRTMRVFGRRAFVNFFMWCVFDR